jgi:hypothetical protein
MPTTINGSNIDEATAPACCRIEANKVICKDRRCELAVCYFRDIKLKEKKKEEKPWWGD